MVIKNSTKWDTNDLRKLWRRCAREVDDVEKPSLPFHKRNKHFQLDVLQSRSGSRGRATVNGYWVMIKILQKVTLVDGKITDDDPQELSLETRTQLARLMIHEYYHTIGFKHQDHRNYKGDWTDDWKVDGWIDQYPIRRKQIAVKEQPDLKLVRYQKAIERLRQAETRLKRAKTLHRKWLLKTRYYEKVCGSKP